MEGTGIRFAEVNITGVPPRARRRHAKSRTGCEPCKKRRIKCDEKTPKCGHCTRKGVPCCRSDRTSPSLTEASQTSWGTGASSAGRDSGGEDQWPLSPSPSPDIDMLQMQLFLHFETDTRFTLVFGPDIWKQCMGLALKNRFLMHAIFMIAAAHIRSTNPENEQLKTAELEHMNGATAGLRQNLAVTLEPAELEPVFAVCILLFNQLWASAENGTGRDGDPSPSIYGDSMVHLGAGFKSFVMGTSVGVNMQHSKIFAEMVGYSPRVELMTFIECTELPPGSRMPQEFENVLRDEYFRIWPERFGQSSLHSMPYMNECRRLTIVLSVLDFERRGLNIRSLDQAIVRYLFTWPILLSPEFVELIKQGARCVMLLFWHYYTVVQASVAGKYWWAQKRADVMVESLGRRLQEEGIEPTNPLAQGG